MRHYIVAVLLALTQTWALAGSEPARFALIGDTPYNKHERAELPALLDAAAQHTAFIIHAGDIKSGNSRCDDALFADRHALFDASTIPFIFVPGDNEWTDCHRVTAGGFDPEERLDALRRLFYPDGHSLGQQRLPLERQPGWPEHQRWRLGAVLFVTLNVPGSNNNYLANGQPSPEFKRRHPEVLNWLRAGFALARSESLPGIVIVMQANPGFKHFAQGVPHAAYRELIEVLRSETRTFAGDVLLVHGDTHWQRTDQPLNDPDSHAPLANFTRIETFGYPALGWVTVEIAEEPPLFRISAHPWSERARP